MWQRQLPRIVALVVIVTVVCGTLPARPALAARPAPAVFPQPQRRIPSPQAVDREPVMPAESEPAPDLGPIPPSLPARASVATAADPQNLVLPLTFMPNRGQTNSQFRYHARGRGAGLYFAPDAIILTLPTSVETPTQTLPPQRPRRRPPHPDGLRRPGAGDADHRQLAVGQRKTVVEFTNGAWQTTAFSYDRMGNVILRDDPRGASFDVTYSYDQLSRIVFTCPEHVLTAEGAEGRRGLQKAHPLRSSACSAVSLNKYLSRPNTTAASGLTTIDADYDALGRRTRLVDGTGTTSFVYDAAGRLTSLSAPHAGTVDYASNEGGYRTRITSPNSGRRHLD